MVGIVSLNLQFVTYDSFPFLEFCLLVLVVSKMNEELNKVCVIRDRRGSGPSSPSWCSLSSLSSLLR